MAIILLYVCFTHSFLRFQRKWRSFYKLLFCKLKAGEFFAASGDFCRLVAKMNFNFSLLLLVVYLLHINGHNGRIHIFNSVSEK